MVKAAAGVVVVTLATLPLTPASVLYEVGACGCGMAVGPAWRAVIDSIARRTALGRVPGVPGGQRRAAPGYSVQAAEVWREVGAVRARRARAGAAWWSGRRGGRSSTL